MVHICRLIIGLVLFLLPSPRSAPYVRAHGKYIQCYPPLEPATPHHGPHLSAHHWPRTFPPAMASPPRSSSTPSPPLLQTSSPNFGAPSVKQALHLLPLHRASPPGPPAEHQHWSFLLQHRE